MKTLAILTVIVALHSTCAASQIVLDQSFEYLFGDNSIDNTRAIAQTFTVGIPGQLTRVEAAVRPGEFLDLSATGEVELMLLKVVNGVPSLAPENILASTVIDLPNDGFESIGDSPLFHNYQWAPLEFPGIEVEMGDVLAIGAKSDTPFSFQWGLSFQDDFSYPGGSGFNGLRSDLTPPVNYDPRDYLFRTYVIPSVPEPASVSLLALAAIVAIIGVTTERRRRCAFIAAEHPVG